MTAELEDGLRVVRVIGTGDPFDVVFMMPLVHQWHAVRSCGLEDPGPVTCEAPIARMVILVEPGIIDDNGNAQSVLAFCEAHFVSWRDVVSPRPRS